MKKSLKKQAVQKTCLFLGSLILFAGCITPARSGMTSESLKIHSSTSAPIDNPNINITVNSLTKKDSELAIEGLKKKFITSVYMNVMLNSIIQQYPDTKITMVITPKEKIYRTWVLDALFIYPCVGYFPFTPWWGSTNLTAQLSVLVPNTAPCSITLSASEPFAIMVYPYYKAGRVLTEKYSVAYNNLFEQIGTYGFSEIAGNITMPTASPIGGNNSRYTFNRGSDVDRDIPQVAAVNNLRFALVIGNEDYTSQQIELKNEVNVDFARNDASAFKEYVQKALGIPEDNIILLLDATTGKMKQALDKMSLLAKNSYGNAEIFFYYAGHGLPDEITKEPYLIPVDVSGGNVTDGIKLRDVYDKLTKYPSKRVTVFLDACFSGGARGQGLIATRGIKVVAKENSLSGNLVVFAASSGEQSSLSYKDKEHGMFTYFLLQKIKDSKGNVTYKELSDYMTKQIGFNSVLKNNKEQTPQTNVSPDVQVQWQNWNLR